MNPLPCALPLRGIPAAGTALLGGLFLVGSGATASACTVCDSVAGEQVRQAIFGPEFGSTLLAVASPFPVLLIVLFAFHFGWIDGGTPARPNTAVQP